MALRAGAVRQIRRLWIRVRSDADGAQALAATMKCQPPPPLEELLIGVGPRPLHIAKRVPRRSLVVPTLSSTASEAVLVTFPRLWLLSTMDVARPMEIWNGSFALPVSARIEGLEAMADDRAGSRTPLGRSLWASEPTLRDAALRVIEHQRSARCFAETLGLLVRPGVLPDHAPTFAALGRLKAGAERVIGSLRRVTGDANHYSTDERKAAGRALFALGTSHATAA